jgi:lipopolysaccharide biosynthesis glycosyltransferase
MKKWVVYCGGNADYILSPNQEPVKMLKSFQRHFKDELDYVYFTDKDEENLEEVKKICDENNIKLVLGDCREYHNQYKDIEYVNRGVNGRWPDAHYWYCEAPMNLIKDYDFAIKCDGDMLCNKKFDLSELESEFAVSIADAPLWYDPFDKHSPNAGFQIYNLKEYIDQQIFHFLRQTSAQPHHFNSDTPALDYLVGNGYIQVKRLTGYYNYLLFDIEEVRQLPTEEINKINIAHFVDSKPHNLKPEMLDSIKHILAKEYLTH